MSSARPGAGRCRARPPLTSGEAARWHWRPAWASCRVLVLGCSVFRRTRRPSTAAPAAQIASVTRAMFVAGLDVSADGSLACPGAIDVFYEGSGNPLWEVSVKQEADGQHPGRSAGWASPAARRRRSRSRTGWSTCSGKDLTATNSDTPVQPGGGLEVPAGLARRPGLRSVAGRIVTRHRAGVLGGHVFWKGTARCPALPGPVRLCPVPCGAQIAASIAALLPYSCAAVDVYTYNCG